MAQASRFIWYENLTSDPEAAMAFYTDLIGWGSTVFDEGGMNYRMYTRGERPIAGTMALPEEAQAQGAPSHWLGYVHVADRDAAVAKAEGLGAKTMVSMDIPEVGDMAVLADPQGALFAVYRPAKDDQMGGEDAELGDVSWHELATEDMDAAWAFYSALFGWDLVEDMDMGEMGAYRMFGTGDTSFGGMFKRPPEMPVNSWLYYVKVPSCADAAGRIQELGGQVVNGPMEVPGGNSIVQGIDPAGSMFALHSAAAQSQEA